MKLQAQTEFLGHQTAPTQPQREHTEPVPEDPRGWGAALPAGWADREISGTESAPLFIERLIKAPALPGCPTSSPSQPSSRPGRFSACPHSPSQKTLSEHFNFAPINQIITEAAACAPLDPGCCRLLGEAVINEKDQLP